MILDLLVTIIVCFSNILRPIVSVYDDPMVLDFRYALTTGYSNATCHLLDKPPVVQLDPGLKSSLERED